MLCNKIEWQRRSDEEKINSIHFVLSLETHNSVTKDDLIMMLDWLFHEFYECGEPCRPHQDRCKGLKVLKGGAE